MNNNRIFGFLVGIIFILAVFLFLPDKDIDAFIGRTGSVTMKTEFVKNTGSKLDWNGIVVNGLSSATSTPYRLGSNQFFGVAWQFKQGTSTPKVKLEWFEGVGVASRNSSAMENIVWETLPAGTLTTTAEQSDTGAIVKTFNPAVCEWIHFKYSGQPTNAANTTMRMWRTFQ